MHFIKTLTPACMLVTALSVGTSYAGDIKGKVTAQGIKSPENIAVYIDAIPGKTFPAPSEHAAMDQRKLTFIPHVLVVLKGTAVDFLNSDAVGHNVFWPAINRDKKLAHNMGTWPQGEKKSFAFNDLGTASLLCNVHSEMSGYVVVVPTPYYAVSSKDGSYEIKNVPPGHYTVTTWSEEGKPTTATVDVTAGTATVDLTVHR
jgi:plastocyanin